MDGITKSDFLPGIFSVGSKCIVMQISPVFEEDATNCLRGGAPPVEESQQVKSDLGDVQYSNIPHIRNSIFHLRPKNVSYNMRLSGNEGQYFLHEGCKLTPFHMSLQCLITQVK